MKRDGYFHLYRHILPPREQRLGFVGYAQSFVSTISAEVPAQWLSAAFRNQLDLPDPSAMDREIEKVKNWAETVFPSAGSGYFIGPYLVHYLDDLLRDLEVGPHRDPNPLREYLGRVLPERYDLGGRA